MIAIKTTNEFNELIKNNKVVVSFGTEWSMPSKMLDMILEEIEEETTGIDFIKVDIDRYRTIAKEYNILNVPVVCLFSNSKVVKQQNGLMRKEELLNLIHQF